MSKPTLSSIGLSSDSQPTLSPIARMVWRAMQGMDLRPGRIIDAKTALHRGISAGLRNGQELVDGLKELHEAGLVDLPEGADNATLTESGFKQLNS